MFIAVDRYNAGNAVRGLAVGKCEDDDPRPTYVPMGGWRLCQDLHDWLVERGIEYKFHWHRERRSVWEVEILNAEERADDAVFFKMKYQITDA